MSLLNARIHIGTCYKLIVGKDFFRLPEEIKKAACHLDAWAWIRKK